MTAMSFIPVDPWTVRYGNVSVQWRPRPMVSSKHVAEMIESRRLDELRQALGLLRLSGVRPIEHRLSELLESSEDEAIVTGVARLLRGGATAASLQALERALPAAIARQQDASVVELVAALYHRRHLEPLRDLVRYAEASGPERLGQVVGLSLIRDLPVEVWPEHLLSRMEEVATARFVAARIRFRRGDKRAERIFRDALAGTASERQMAAAALASVGGRQASDLLQSALEREQDLSLQLMMCACLGRDCSTAIRTAIVTRASAHEDPFMRYQAALQLGLLPGRERRGVVRGWLKREPDRVIRHLLRKGAVVRRSRLRARPRGSRS